MFQDSSISEEMFNTYYNLVKLYKQKNAMSVKLDELISILQYLNSNYENYSAEEKELFKNIIIISKAIVNGVNNNQRKTQEKLEKCIVLINELEKKKEPSKIK